MEENNNLIQKDMEEVLSSSFLTFAGYNLQRRAIPDARDGLKWGGRQLLHAQMLGGFTYNKPFKKAIKSVSQAMGFSYVHGDASAYGTFIRMAKPFSYRYPLQEANGNYGTLINPDDHSASRYVELRGSELTSLLLEDLDKDTIIEWEDTYDLEGRFPRVLPSKGFYGIVNGCISIGSGMSCSIPPTNLKEVNEALIKLIQNPNIDIDEIICYPDFPTGAMVLNKNEVRESMIRGYGSACKMRAVVEYDDKERCFVVKEMPYSTFTNTICNELASLIESDPDCGIKDFVDYTGTKPDLRIYLAKNVNPGKVLKNLYKNTSLQSYYSINMVMLDKGITPKIFGWREALQAHIDHEKEVYRRGFEYDLSKIESRIHIIDGLLICLASIDEVIKTIKSSNSTQDANKKLCEQFLLDNDQAKAVLAMKLSSLAKLEVQKLKDEKDSLIKESERIKTILNNEQLFNNELIKGWRETSKKFGDNRRTQILNIEGEEEETVEKKNIQISLTNKNQVYINEVSNLYIQKRTAAGSKLKLDDGEYIINSSVGNTIDNIIFFGSNGMVYSIPATIVPFDTKTYINTLIKIPDTEEICATACINKNTNNKYVVIITKNGMIKKSKLDEYNLNRKSGVKGIELVGSDEISNILFMNEEKLGILTQGGQFIICETKDITPIGRVAKGIKGIKLDTGDEVASAKVISNDTKEILSISSIGYCKRTNINEFHTTGRNVKGVKIQKIAEGDFMVDFLPITNETEVLISSSKSRLKTKLSDISLLGRATSGVKSIKLKAKDEIVNLNYV